MTPIYFPFTHIPDTILAAVLHLFGGITLYLPSSDARSDTEETPPPTRGLQKRRPLVHYNGLIERAFKDHMNWADYHDKNQLRMLQSRMNAIPFFDDASAFKIKSEISRNPDPVSETALSADFRAGLFLMCAHKLDREYMDIKSRIKRIDDRAQDMFTELKGDDTPVPSRGAVDDDGPRQADMIRERLDAWACLMLRDIPDSCLFLTAGQEVIDVLEDDNPDMARLVGYAAIPVTDHQGNAWDDWRESLNAYIAGLAAHPASQQYALPPELPVIRRDGDCLALTLYIIDGVAPPTFFTRFSRQFSCDRQKSSRSSDCRNTLIGVVTF